MKILKKKAKVKEKKKGYRIGLNRIRMQKLTRLNTYVGVKVALS